MAKRPTLLVDFDGVLHDYHGWTGPEAKGLPIEKSRAAMYRLEKTYRLVCFTTRPVEHVQPWLARNGFPEMKITNVKEPAHVIIDDRAIQFDGQWSDELLSRITSFTPHWGHSGSESHAGGNAHSRLQPGLPAGAQTLPVKDS